MADNFGDQQTRVLNVQRRGIENVVFQFRRPPLTSEWNLINQISNEKVQEFTRLAYPSGWLNVGEILQNTNPATIVTDEDNVQTGQVICSEAYAPNSFKFFARDLTTVSDSNSLNGSANVAIVNGWPVIVQASNSPNSHNIITLGDPGGQIYDFVFLEVWKKLIGTADSLYPFGNVQTSPYSDNEIEWDAVGTETTKRVQIQYRIRVEDINTVLSPTSDAFDSTIYPIGGRTTGEYAFTSYAFRKFGATDIGLYVSGDGSDDSKTALNTVDGYVYAIPMFLVYRRIESASIFDASHMKQAYTTTINKLTGYVYDRPDSKLADAVYKEDIVDFRHKVLSSGKVVEELLQQSVSKLVAGELTTALKRGFDANGATTSASSGGSTLMKVERLNSVGGDGIPSVGQGSDTTPSTFKRRAFCNAEVIHDHNIIEIPHTGPWAALNTFNPVSLLTLPDGAIVSIDGFYNTTVGPVTGITPTLPVAPTTFTVGAGSNLVTPVPQTSLLMEFTFKYNSSSSGFKDVPKQFLEVDKGTYIQIATRDRDVPLRFNNTEELLNFGATVPPGVPGVPGETNANDVVRYKGGNYTENSYFGHEMVVYRTAVGIGSVTLKGSVTLSMSDGKYNGHYILGVKSVEPKVLGSYIDPTGFSAYRAINPVSPYENDYYLITLFSYPAGTDVRITLYTGSKPPPPTGGYSSDDSFKFFELSKQGRGILDTYEVIEVIGDEDGSTGTYWVDSGDKPIIGLLKAVKIGSYIEAFGWKINSTISDATVRITLPDNQNLPVLGSSNYSATLLPTKIKVTATSGLGSLRVPLLVHSYVTQTETPYNFYYKTNAYQGLLDSTTEYYGKIVKEDTALITTLGSGAVSNYDYQDGYAIFQSSSRTVLGAADGNGHTPEWSAYVKSGDYIRQGTSSSQYYRILTVDSDTQLTLAELFAGTPVPSGEAYEIIRMDVTYDNISNVVDRLPSFLINAGTTTDLVDYHCYSDKFSTSTFAGALYFTKPLHKRQDPLNTIANDFKVGASALSKRGRNNFLLTNGMNPIFKLSDTPRPDIFYEHLLIEDEIHLPDHQHKVYQVYLFNQSSKGLITSDSDLTGRLYMMVVSGEVVSNNSQINSLNGFYSVDSVDLFEMVGRPIIKLG